MADSSKLPNAAARYVYMEAMQLEWPEVLSALQRDVFPRLLELWNDRLSTATNLFSKKYNQFSDAMSDRLLVQALKAWAITFSVEDEWMLENARVTMYMYGANWTDTQEEWPVWMQAGPKHLSYRHPFEMNLKGLWIPPEHGGLQTWEEFSGNFESELTAALNRYRKLQTTHFGVLRDNVRRDARWTVRYQKGQLASDIAKELPHAYGDPAQTVWKAIDRFAKDIELTVRPYRRRRTAK
jgi:hypothetical protein